MFWEFLWPDWFQTGSDRAPAKPNNNITMLAL